MFPIPKSEKLIETRQCRHCQTDFPITDKDLEFYDKVSPTFAGIKYQIPAPTLCPDCRQQRRLSWRNERKLYKRKCDATGKDIISIYSPDKPFGVFGSEYWWSDNWDALRYGIEYDPAKRFFEQFYSLVQACPKIALNNGINEWSPYNNDTSGCKNTYLCFFSSLVEDSFYINWSYKVDDSADIGWSQEIENSHECFNCNYVSDSSYLFDCDHCQNSKLLRDCVNCQNCFWCVGLRNKKYYFFNKPYSASEYVKKLEEYCKLKNLTEIQKEWKDFQKNFPVRSTNMWSSEDCTGDFIYASKNCTHCFEMEKVDEGKYSSQCARLANVYHCDNSGWWEGMLFEGLAIYDSTNVIFSSDIIESKSVMYSSGCFACSDIFGCVGLRNKEYCIFNKQYSREEYETLVPRIVTHMKTNGEWGEFFPSILSPFGYNETVANEYFPLDRNVAIPGRFAWSDFEPPFPAVSKIIPAAKLPSDIAAVPDDILNWAIECEVTGKPFKIIKQELEFYRKHGLPIPRRHPDQRHLDRMSLRNPRKLYEHDCDKCWKKMITTYTPDRPEKVYCEACYNQEVS